MTPRSDASADDSPSPRKRWRRRCGAVMLGLLVVVAVEYVCRLAGWGDPRLREDPFVGFADQRPLFVLSEDGSTYQIPRVREDYFARDSFAAEKGADERRIFCLGGSTVQGRPYSIQTSFGQWLELGLNAVDKTHQWDVVNCGGISYASYRLLPILEECLHYEPDLIILCTGHNEFLEDRTYSDVSRSELLHRTSKLRLVNLTRDVLDRLGNDEQGESFDPERTILPMETEPILNFNDGLAAYHRDEPWQRGVIEHFETNVRRMLDLAQAYEVPILLIQPASNLKDCPPFKSEHREDLKATDEEQWVSLIDQAREAAGNDSLQAARLYERAIAIDPEYPLTHYELGRVFLTLRDYDAARRSFVHARDLDVCPLRMLTEMEQRLSTIVSETGVPFLNLHEFLESRTSEGILGDGELIDHIHPSIEGHQQIAEALLDRLSTMGTCTLPVDWPSSARSAFEAHLESLDSAYFLRGQRMLHGLQEWTRGRADGPPASERFPDRISPDR